MKKQRMLLFLISLLGAVSTRAQVAYNFRLPDDQGKTVQLNSLIGKVVVLDFWFTGCINCMHFYQSTLSPAEKHFGHEPGVVFVSICIDKSKTTWLTSLSKGRYASAGSVNLYTMEQGGSHPVVKGYAVQNYPQPFLIGKDGKIISRSDELLKPDELIIQIQNALKK